MAVSLVFQDGLVQYSTVHLRGAGKLRLQNQLLLVLAIMVLTLAFLAILGLLEIVLCGMEIKTEDHFRTVTVPIILF